MPDATSATTDRSSRRDPFVRLYSSAPDAPRLRRPADVLMLLVAIVVLALLAIPAPGPSDLDTALVDLVRAVPGLGGWLWEICYILLALWGVLLLAVTAFTHGRRRLFGDLVLAAALAVVFALMVGRLSGTDPVTSLRGLVRTEPPAVYVGVLLAVSTALVVAASPHVARPVRTVGRLILLVGAVAGIDLGVAVPIGMAGGFFVGVAAAATTHLLLGSPDGRPTVRQVRGALADLGVTVHDVRQDRRGRPGVAVFEATATDESTLRVNVYGRDARDNELLLSLWRSLWMRGETPRLSRGRLGIVEHEAVVTLLAERGGVRVAAVRAVGLSVDGDALLVTGRIGRALTELTENEVTDTLLADAWTQLEKLHGLGMSHGRIDDEHVRVAEGGRVLLTDLTQAELSAGEVSIGSDRARLLVTTAILASDERAVGAARTALGDEGLGAVLAYLQPAVLDRRTRARVEDGRWDLAALRARAAQVSGVDPPALERLRRLRLKDVVLAAGGALLGYLVVSRLLDVDWAGLWSELGSAEWAWLVAALLASPLVGVALGFSTMGACLRPLRYGPVVMLQWAIQFMAVVLPSTAARIALDVRFFQRFGVPAGAAVSIGLIDSFSGFVIQALLLLVILVSPLPGLTEPLAHGQEQGSDGGHTGLLILAALVVVVVVSLLLPVTRRRIRARVPKIRQAIREQSGAAMTALGVVRRPVKVTEMLVGNLGAQLVQAVVLALCLHAFGADAHFSQLVLINTVVALFGGLMPVPGGVGVCEAAMTAGLQAVGIPATVALSTAIAYRLATFYLPPLWGSFAMGWLRRRSYV